MPRSIRHKRLVFISHSSQDTWVAEQIARHITAAGAEFFLDKAHLGVGVEFEEEIGRHLRRCDELLVLLTPWALTRPYIWVELGVAWFRKVRLIGVLQGMTAAELQSKPELTVFMKRLNLIPLNEIGRYFEELGARAKSHDQKPKTS